MKSIRFFRILFSIALLFVISSCSLLFKSYTIQLTSEPDVFGTIISDPSVSSFLEGTEVILTAVPAAGCVFDRWVGVDSLSSDAEVATVVMNSHRNVTAIFKPELELTNKYDGVYEPLSSDFAPLQDDSWTFMVYLDGDNNLSSYADDDFDEILAGCQAADNPYLNIIVLKDGTGVDDSVYCQIETTGAVELKAPAELNMGDPDTLSDFIEYTLTEYDTEHYALIFWNHGGGARSIVQEEVSRQICVDETSSNDSLFLDEVQQAVTNSLEGFDKSLEFIGMDACVMGTIETAYELRFLTDYFAASMSSVSFDGWDYTELFGGMAESASSAPSAEELSRLVVKTYADSTLNQTDQSLSAIKTSGLTGLKTAVDQLASALYDADRKEVVEVIRDASKHFYDYDYEAEAISMPYHDLNDFCNLIYNNKKYLNDAVAEKALAVMESLGKTVVAAYAGDDYGGYYGSGNVVKRGLSIFISNGDRLYNGYSHYSYQYWYTDYDLSSTDYWSDLEYGLIDFCTSDDDGIVESWRELMEVWYDPYRNPYGYTPGKW